MNVSFALLLVVAIVTNGLTGYGTNAAATLEKAVLDKPWTTSSSVQESASQIVAGLALPTRGTFQTERTGFQLIQIANIGPATICGRKLLVLLALGVSQAPPPAPTSSLHLPAVLSHCDNV